MICEFPEFIKHTVKGEEQPNKTVNNDEYDSEASLDLQSIIFSKRKIRMYFQIKPNTKKEKLIALHIILHLFN